MGFCLRLAQAHQSTHHPAPTPHHTHDDDERQLQTDAAYLLTVLQNLEVAAPPLLGALHAMCNWAGEEGDGGSARLLRLAGGEGEGEGEGESATAMEEPAGVRAARRRLARKVAEARGWLERTL